VFYMVLVMKKVIDHHHIVIVTEKRMTVPQLDKKFPTFYDETQKFIMMFTAAQHWPPVFSTVSHTPILLLETTL